MILYTHFSAGGADYLYDTATNAIVRLPEGVAPGLEAALAAATDAGPCGEAASCRDGAIDGGPATAFVRRARARNGLFADRPPRSYRGILDRDFIRDRLDTGMRGLLLGVTDRCNQRCGYCIYSGSYAGHRTHGSGRMPWDVARRSMDFFAEHADRGGTTFITFYGGEPLLAWDLVRRCVEYARGLGIPDLILLLNTNLTLLTEARAAFLVENDVALAVSLDGPAPVHDAFRVFPSGAPTYERVVGWLTYLRDHHREYWKRRVVLHATVEACFDVEEVFDHFCDERWRDLDNTMGGVRDDAGRRRSGGRKAELRHQASLDRILDRYAASLESGEPMAHSLLRTMFRTVFADIPARTLGYPPPEAHPMKTCLPGVARLYVDMEGHFYPCEKTDVVAARIGHVDRGVDVGKVRALLERQVSFCESDCVGCWASRLCRLCLTHFIDGGRVSRSAIRLRCRRERDRIRRSLERFTRLYTGEPPEVWEHPFSLHRAVADAQREQEEVAR